MAAHLPEDWISKRVAVYLEGVHLEGRLISDSGNALTIEAIDDRVVERIFVPWPSIRFVYLLAGPDKSGSQSGRA
jgi:hypothetical protein